LNELKASIGNSKYVVIVGGGLTGLEFADELSKNQDLRVTLLEVLPRCLSMAFDDEFCLIGERRLESQGVDVLTGVKVDELLGVSKVEYVLTSTEEMFPADTVLLSTGMSPDIDLAERSGLSADLHAGILVNDYMQTSDPDIFAAGDCASKRFFLDSTPSFVKLASVACAEGRVAGANLYTPNRLRCPVVGAFCTVIGDLALGSVGITERAAQQMGLKVLAGEAKAPNRHPGCMPGSIETGVKLVFEKDSTLLVGGQVYGGSSVGEMVNVLSVAAQRGMRAHEMVGLQVATHPALTPSPLVYHFIAAAENALCQ